MKMERFIVAEKNLLEEVHYPFIVKLKAAKKDKFYIFLFLEYIEGKDFFDVLREIGFCNEESARFYVASFLLCLEHLHAKNIVYRDLKPENAAIDGRGYLHLVDMGTAKKLSSNS